MVQQGTRTYEGERIEKSLVEVICDSTSVLHLAKHVAHGVPRHTYNTNTVSNHMRV